MKVGDKILVTYSDGDQFAGRIYGETEKSWRVEFDDGSKKTVRKTTDIQVIEDPEMVAVSAEDFVAIAEEGVGPVEVPDYVPTHYTPSKRLKRKNLVILLFILAVAAVIGVVIVKSIGLF